MSKQTRQVAQDSAASYDSFRQGKVKQGIFRGLLVLGSVTDLRALLRPVRRADPQALARIVKYLKSIDALDSDSPYNLAQIQRLREGKWSRYDRTFYAHEPLEARLVRQGVGLDEAHLAALKQLNHTGFDLYDPAVVRQCDPPSWSVRGT